MNILEIVFFGTVINKLGRVLLEGAILARLFRT